MENIITRLYQLIKNTNNLIELEENIQTYMQEVFSSLLGEIFTQLDQVIKKKRQDKGWKIKREDWKTVQFSFGAVRFRHTLMGDEKGTPIILLMNGWEYKKTNGTVHLLKSKLQN
ncbi:UPF0236 family transposase-like protein [Tepidibacillus decaturensis]|uniref:Uncharacterized protein n=1 Tax=Tepidibacillus decaturensis TaxID=1413211 RepID=A0A135L0Z1_9BACI|nr:UPF0236 family protein [Tepidibacillus decaturensis]KXG42671.1 hypothetical protein U473_00370 [Tepidibacillus decaturensis]